MRLKRKNSRTGGCSLPSMFVSNLKVFKPSWQPRPGYGSPSLSKSCHDSCTSGRRGRGAGVWERAGQHTSWRGLEDKCFAHAQLQLGHVRHAARHTEQPAESGKSNPTFGRLWKMQIMSLRRKKNRTGFGACARAWHLLLLCRVQLLAQYWKL